MTDVGTVTGGTGGVAGGAHGTPGTASPTNLLVDYTPYIQLNPGPSGDQRTLPQTWYNPGEIYDTSQSNPTGSNPASKRDGDGGDAAPAGSVKTAGTRGGYGWMMIFEDVGP